MHVVTLLIYNWYKSDCNTNMISTEYRIWKTFIKIVWSITIIYATLPKVRTSTKSLNVCRRGTRFCRERYKCEVVNGNFSRLWHLSYIFLDIDDCIGVTCSFHGICVDGVNSHTCSCEAGYTGDSCATGIFRYFVLCSMRGREVTNELQKRSKLVDIHVFGIFNPTVMKTAKLTWPSFSIWFTFWTVFFLSIAWGMWHHINVV